MFGLLIDQEMKLHLSEVIAADGLYGGTVREVWCECETCSQVLDRLTESCLQFVSEKKREIGKMEREKK